MFPQIYHLYPFMDDLPNSMPISSQKTWLLAGKSDHMSRYIEKITYFYISINMSIIYNSIESGSTNIHAIIWGFPKMFFLNEKHPLNMD